MIIKPLLQKDYFKEEIEKINKDIGNQEIIEYALSKQKEYFDVIKENLPILKNNITDRIDKLIKKVQQCNAIQLLDYFATIYGFTDEDNLIENIDSDKNFKLDYLHSLILAVGNIKDVDCNENIFNEIDKIIEEIKNLSIIYLMLTSDYHGLPNQTKFLQTIHNLIVRGDSYKIHKVNMCRELFVKFDDLLIKTYKINSKQLIDGLVNIEDIILVNIEKQKVYFNEIILSHKKFIEQLDSLDSEKEQFKFIQNYHKSKEAKSIRKKFQEIYSEIKVSFGETIFKLNSSILPKDILEYLSINIGDNKQFRNGKIEFFPTNESLIYNKPLIKIENQYYCFNYPLIVYNLHTILEDIILNIIPPKRHQKNYYKKKGEYLEDKVLSIFKEIMPDCSIYQNLKYNEDDEVDGIVIFDNNIFIIEAKSGKFSKGAKKGNIEKIKTDTKKLIEEAYIQAVRAKQYILSNKEVEFRDKSKKTVLRLKKENINNIYLINITLEPFNHISANLSSLKEFGFVEDDEWIWSVYLNDLKIISEILDSPSEFLLYVTRRIRFNDYTQIKMAEELDIFGYFLSEGLYFDDIKFPENGFKLTIDSSFSKDIDMYFYSKEIGKEYKKPTLFYRCKDNIKFLVKKIEKIGKKNFTKLTTMLLNFDCNTQSFIKKELENILNGKRNDFSLPIKDKNLGVTFINKILHDHSKIKELIELYCYEHKINHWFVVTVDKNYIDFEEFSFKNGYNYKLNNKLNKLKEYRLKQALNIKSKIGRNELCPCGSGKKYKKCCMVKRY